MNFLSMWQFWIGFVIGIFIGCIAGYFTAALCCISGRESRLEEMREQLLMKDEDKK